MIKWLSTHGEDPCDLTSVSIDWKPFRTARKEVTLQMQLFITKWLSGDTATGRIMCRRHSRNSSSCPRCGQSDEHLLHVIRCPSTIDYHTRHLMIQKLGRWFDDRQTHPDISNFFITGLSKWFFNRNYIWNGNSIIFSDSSVINTSLRSQLHISWYYFLCGMISRKITKLQHLHYNQLHSKR